MISKHIIRDIRYADDYLLCICGWAGSANNLKEYSKHRSDTKGIPLEIDTELDIVQGIFQPQDEKHKQHRRNKRLLEAIEF